MSTSVMVGVSPTALYPGWRSRASNVLLAVSIPADATGTLIAALPQEMQFAARLTAIDMTTVPRLDPPATEAERDDLFRLAATL